MERTWYFLWPLYFVFIDNYGTSKIRLLGICSLEYHNTSWWGFHGLKHFLYTNLSSCMKWVKVSFWKAVWIHFLACILIWWKTSIKRVYVYVFLKLNLIFHPLIDAINGPFLRILWSEWVSWFLLLQQCRYLNRKDGWHYNITTP